MRHGDLVVDGDTDNDDWAIFNDQLLADGNGDPQIDLVDNTVYRDHLGASTPPSLLSAQLGGIEGSFKPELTRTDFDGLRWSQRPRHESITPTAGGRAPADTLISRRDLAAFAASPRAEGLPSAFPNARAHS